MHYWPLVAAGLSPDGRWGSTAADDRTVRVWDVATSQPLGPPRHFAVQFAFSKDGSRLFSVTDNGAFSVWDLSADEGAGDRPLLAAVLSGRRLEPAGVAPLESAEFARNWSALRTKPWWSGFGTAPVAPASWHARQAEQCKAEGEWSAAVWHLDRCVQVGKRPSWRLYVRRARAREKLGRWQAAAADYDAALKEKTDDWELWHARGTCLAVLGRWDGAVRDFGRAAGFRGASVAARADLALARLSAGDEAGYRAACRDLLRPADPLQVFTPPAPDTLRACLLVQGAVPNLFPPATTHSAPGMPVGYVAALFYRCGKYEEAVELCTRGLARLPPKAAGEEDAYQTLIASTGYDRPCLCLLQAMAHHRLKKTEAGRWLARARQDRTAGPRLPRRAWQRRLEWERLLREAEGLLSAKQEGKRP